MKGPSASRRMGSMEKGLGFSSEARDGSNSRRIAEATQSPSFCSTPRQPNQLPVRNCPLNFSGQRQVEGNRRSQPIPLCFGIVRPAFSRLRRLNQRNEHRASCTALFQTPCACPLHPCRSMRRRRCGLSIARHVLFMVSVTFRTDPESLLVVFL